MTPAKTLATPKLSLRSTGMKEPVKRTEAEARAEYLRLSAPVKEG